MTPRSPDLLRWFRRSRRDLPWREPPGAPRDPYRVWLSEVLLQQTRAAAAAPRFRELAARWPTVGDLARASEEEVLDAWAGLGYYRRARALHRTARIVAARGGFPRTAAGLRALPGIGPYTAAAVAALAFGERVAAVDGNVLRVMARLHGVDRPLAAARRELEAHAARLVPARDPGAHAEAVMELGALVCTPRRPRCPECPWRGACRARREGREGEIPPRAERAPPPVRRGVAFVLRRADGRVLLRRNGGTGPLAGMLVPPGTAWEADAPSADRVRAARPAACRWRRLPGEVRHGFTHLALRLEVRAGRVADARGVRGTWVDPAGSRARLPALTRKVLAHAGAAALAGPARRG